MFYLPDTMVNWPWPRAINPHFEDVKTEVDAAFRDFRALDPKSQEAFDKCDLDHLRIGCDLMNVFFIFDEYTDKENAAVTKEMMDIVLDALHDPHKMRPEGECILGEIVRQFWARAIQTASQSFQRHFLDSYTAYIHAVVGEAEDRDHSHCRSIDDYLKLRRDTSGAAASLTIHEMSMEFPDEVFYHLMIVELRQCVVELIVVDNDMASYNREQATGDENHNLITAIMLELGLDRSGAMAWAARYHTQVGKQFMDGLAQYLDGMAAWARANHCWSYESQRYFGTEGTNIQQSRLVPLLPKIKYGDASSMTKSVEDAGLEEKNVLK
ncbi:terpenoid synthase [Suillus fuscotomentosus]|uniref:Terpene synthase n=1 Tax=Suillus fuscotomentosus TaxID=1912939 RepID=A0AAD4EAR0_9AGAM|nr:terpenoid synthase [Suillus fuscotomentosus]KAG1902830.1 terpenoid synthase [Suillus fuscotomentosus]